MSASFDRKVTSVPVRKEFFDLRGASVPVRKEFFDLRGASVPVRKASQQSIIKKRNTELSGSVFLSVIICCDVQAVRMFRNFTSPGFVPDRGFYLFRWEV